MSVAFRPNDKHLATGSMDSTARVCDVTSGMTVAILKGHKRIVNGVAFSPNGKQLPTGSMDSTARV
jgi:WD40 repeat protein